MWIITFAETGRSITMAASRGVVIQLTKIWRLEHAFKNFHSVHSVDILDALIHSKLKMAKLCNSRAAGS
jgi:hypothetical protein